MRGTTRINPVPLFIDSKSRIVPGDIVVYPVLIRGVVAKFYETRINTCSMWLFPTPLCALSDHQSFPYRAQLNTMRHFFFLSF